MNSRHSFDPLVTYRSEDHSLPQRWSARPRLHSFGALMTTPPSLKVNRPRRAMSRISILGSGVVGRATGIGLSTIGHDVTFVDIDEDRLTILRNEGHATQHVNGMTLDQTDAVFVAVPTPAADDGVDTSYLESACKTLGRLLQTTERGSEPKLSFSGPPCRPARPETRSSPPSRKDRGSVPGWTFWSASTRNTCGVQRGRGLPGFPLSDVGHGRTR